MNGAPRFAFATPRAFHASGSRSLMASAASRLRTASFMRSAFRNASVERTTEPFAGADGLNHPWPLFPHPRGRDFVDFDEDLQVKDLVNAMAEGFDHIAVSLGVILLRTPVRIGETGHRSLNEAL